MPLVASRELQHQYQESLIFHSGISIKEWRISGFFFLQESRKDAAARSGSLLVCLGWLFFILADLKSAMCSSGDTLLQHIIYSIDALPSHQSGLPAVSLMKLRVIYQRIVTHVPQFPALNENPFCKVLNPIRDFDSYVVVRT